MGERENHSNKRLIVVDIINTDQLQTWIDEFGPGLGLRMSNRSLATCWARHPQAVHEITGLYLAWTALSDAFNPPDPEDHLAAFTVPSPRDWLDLSNASTGAVDRATKTATTCARAGHHIG